MPDKGAFLNPSSFMPTSRWRRILIHDVEAFGPVCTVMPYDDLDEAVALDKARQGLARRVSLH